MRRSIRHRLAHAIGVAALATAAFAPQPGIAQTKPPLTVGIAFDMTTMDPHRISSGSDDNLFANVFEVLFGIDTTGALVPVLGESYELSPDGKTYDIKLRAGVKFHNGDPMTAEDVRYSWQRGIDPSILNPRAVVVLRNIEDVEVVDPLRVRLKLKAPDAATLQNMEGTFYILSKKYMTEGAGKDEATRVPMGTGPFMYVDRKVREFIKIKSFDGHWGRVPQIGEVTMRIVPDAQARFALIQTGEADIISSVPTVVAAKVKDNADFRILRGPGLVNLFFQIHTRSNNPDLKKPEVRRAINMAINKKALLDVITQGFATGQNGAPCTPQILGCNPPPADIPFDVAGAKALLTKANFNFARPLSIVAPASGNIPQSRETAEAIAYSLQQAGIKTNLVIKEYGAWLSGDQQAKQPKNPEVDIVLSRFPDYNTNPGARLRRTIMTDGVSSWFSDPELDAMIDKLNTIPSEKEREAHAKALWQKTHELVPTITLWAYDTVFAARGNVEWTPQFGNLNFTLWNAKKK